MVTRRFLAIFFPAAEFLVTTRITRVENEPFKTEGKVMLNARLAGVYGRELASDESPNLVPVQSGEQRQHHAVEVVANQTKPPARFTEATLLGAMEGAGKLVEDEELRAAMSEKGLGTPATRAAIIEGLLHEKYLLAPAANCSPPPRPFRSWPCCAAWVCRSSDRARAHRQLGVQTPANRTGPARARTLSCRKSPP
jgi:DNA topoisomerase III